MQDAPIPQRPPQKPMLRQKERKSQILEAIRESLDIPNHIPRGGPELQKYLKKVGSKRLRMAMDPIMPLYNEFFKGKFTLQKLYLWAENNGKIHKRCLMQSEEITQHVLETAKEKQEQGFSKKSLQATLAQVIGQDDPSFIKIKISKSSVYRWTKVGRNGSKKVKLDADYHQNTSPEDVSTQQHSPVYEESSAFPKQLFEFPLDKYLDVEAFKKRTDAWASDECLIAMVNLIEDFEQNL